MDNKINKLERIFSINEKWFNGERKEVNPKSLAREPVIIKLNGDTETVGDKILKINQLGISFGANAYAEGSPHNDSNKKHVYVPITFYKI
jgi:hypothetical protein